MNWFEISIESLKKIVAQKHKDEALRIANDLKYGSFDYENDARYLNRDKFEENFKSIIHNFLDKADDEILVKALVVGANSGDEIGLLGSMSITALDISKKALKTLEKIYPYVRTLWGQAEKLPFPSNSFDLFVSMRTLQSHGLDMESALDEAIRVTKPRGMIVISIPNGYALDGQLVKGMYSNQSQSFDNNKPYELVNKVKTVLKDKSAGKIEVLDIFSEIIVSAKV